MQKRKFDELISHFNRKVSDMSIDQKYKMELLGMISAIGFAHEKELSTNLAEVGKDCISREQAIDGKICIQRANGVEIYDDYAVPVEYLKQLPPIQPERTCVNCGRTANNGGWYADGRTRCPIEEHYALPKDGYCHLWEQRNITDDDYPERRTDD